MLQHDDGAGVAQRALAGHGSYFLSRMSMNVRNSERVRASLAERAEHLAGDHRHAALVDAARGHALVHRLDHDADAARLQHVVDAAGDLGRHLLLDLEATREDVDDARELRDADHLGRRQVAHVGPADDRRHVVLAVRLELDVAQHDHLVVAGHLLERAAQVVAGVDGVARDTSPCRPRRPASACRGRPSRAGSSPAQRSRVRTASSAAPCHVIASCAIGLPASIPCRRSRRPSQRRARPRQ